MDKAYSFGSPGWKNVTGDWNGDGKSEIGVTNGQQWYLDWNGNGVFDSGWIRHIRSVHPDGRLLLVTGMRRENRILVSRTDNSGIWTGTGTESLTSEWIRPICSVRPGGPLLLVTGSDRIHADRRHERTAVVSGLEREWSLG